MYFIEGKQRSRAAGGRHQKPAPAEAEASGHLTGKDPGIIVQRALQARQRAWYILAVRGGIDFDRQSVTVGIEVHHEILRNSGCFEVIEPASAAVFPVLTASPGIKSCFFLLLKSTLRLSC
jgi:hypothetical protein